METWKIIFAIVISTIIIFAIVGCALAGVELDRRFKEIDKEVEKSEEKKRIRLARQNGEEKVEIVE